MQPETIERQRLVAQMKRKKKIEEEQRNRTKQNIQQLRDSKRQKAQFDRLAREKQSKDQKSDDASPAKIGKDDCMLLIRLDAGGQVKQSFPTASTLQDVWNYVSKIRLQRSPEASPNFGFISPGFPRREFKPEESSLTLKEAGLSPRGSLIVKAGKSEVRRGTQTGGKELLFRKLVHCTKASASGKESSIGPEDILVVFFCSQGHRAASIVQELQDGMKKDFPEIFFGYLDTKGHKDLALSFGVGPVVPIAHIYKGSERVSVLGGAKQGFHPAAIEREIRKHANIPDEDDEDDEEMTDELAGHHGIKLKLKMRSKTEEQKVDEDMVFHPSEEDAASQSCVIKVNKPATAFEVVLVGSPQNGYEWSSKMNPFPNAVIFQISRRPNVEFEYRATHPGSDGAGCDGHFVFKYSIEPPTKNADPSPSSPSSLSSSSSPSSFPTQPSSSKPPVSTKVGGDPSRRALVMEEPVEKLNSIVLPFEDQQVVLLFEYSRRRWLENDIPSKTIKFAVTIKFDEESSNVEEQHQDMDNSANGEEDQEMES